MPTPGKGLSAAAAKKPGGARKVSSAKKPNTTMKAQVEKNGGGKGADVKATNKSFSKLEKTLGKVAPKMLKKK